MQTIFTIQSLRALYVQKMLTPAALLDIIKQRIARDSDNPVWIHTLTDEQLAPYLARLQTLDIDTHPLWGIPFAIKDNIDLADIPTTAACPAYAYTPLRSASVVQKLLDAGAIPVGKTNLDQFATGLVGTRSPYGEVKNAFLPAYISGGSSSGSAVAVALGHAVFALGTDTAGSGRVPAALNHLVGVKPTRGLLSTQGVVPACRTLDCVSVFAHDLADATLLLQLAQGFDAEDCYSRAMALPVQTPATMRIGVPQEKQRVFFGDAEAQALFDTTLAEMRGAGAALVELDFSPFVEAAELLYNGPWVAERWLTAQQVLREQPDTLLDVTRTILSSANTQTAAETFAAFYRLAALRRAAEAQLADVDAVCTPTIGRPYLREEIRREPLLCNSQLGYYTNFMNLLDLAALAVPSEFFSNGLPNGITLFADAGSDMQLLGIAKKLFPHSAGIAENVTV